MTLFLQTQFNEIIGENTYLEACSLPSGYNTLTDQLFFSNTLTPIVNRIAGQYAGIPSMEQIMAKVTFKIQRCKGCGICVITCPKALLSMNKTINQSGYSIARIENMAACTGCGLCAEMCPDVVISVYK